MRRGFVLWVLVPALLLLPSCRRSEQENAEGEGSQVVQGQPGVATESQPADDETGQDDPFAVLGADAGCYVCHMTFVEEELSAVHREAKVGCTKCHGTSAGHANDENIGATKPDVLFKVGEINLFCRTCHETHDVAPEKIVARWRERNQGQSTTQPTQQVITCTGCHGEHKISDGQ